MLNLPDTRSDRSFLFHGYRSRIGQPIGEEKRKSGRVRKYVKFITIVSRVVEKGRERELNVMGYNYRWGWTENVRGNFSALDSATRKIRDHGTLANCRIDTRSIFSIRSRRFVIVDSAALFADTKGVTMNQRDAKSFSSR